MTESTRNDALAALDRLAELYPGWDGYQGVAPSQKAIDAAKAFVRALPAETPTPSIEPSGDGEINLVWYGGGYLEVGTYGDGWSAYAKPEQFMSYVAGLARVDHFRLHAARFADDTRAGWLTRLLNWTLRRKCEWCARDIERLITENRDRLSAA